MTKFKLAALCIIILMAFPIGCKSPNNLAPQTQEDQEPNPTDDVQRGTEGGSVQIGNPPMSVRNLTAEAKSVSGSELPADSPQASEMNSDPNISFSEFRISWDPPEETPVSYEVERKVGQLGEYANAANVTPPKTEAVEFGGLGATHYYRVKSTDAEGNSGYSDETKVRVTTSCSYPGGWVMVYPAAGCSDAASGEKPAGGNRPLNDILAYNSTILLARGSDGGAGLVVIDAVTGKWSKIDVFQNISVNKIVRSKPEDVLYLATSAGLYQGTPGKGWEKIGAAGSDGFKYVSVTGPDVYAIQPTDRFDGIIHLRGGSLLDTVRMPHGLDWVSEFSEVAPSKLTAVAGSKTGGVINYDTPLVMGYGSWLEQGLPKSTASERVNYRSVSADFNNLVQTKETNGAVTYCLYQKADSWKKACDDKYRALAWIDGSGKEYYGVQGGDFSVDSIAIVNAADIWTVENNLYLLRLSE